MLVSKKEINKSSAGELMTEKKNNPRKGFIAYNKEKDLTFWCKSESRFANHWNLPQSKISECLNEKIDSCKGWIFYFPDKDMQPLIEWKLKNGPSFIYIDNSKHIFSIIDENAAYLKGKFRDN